MIRHAIERPVSTLIGAATLVVLGTFSLLRLPVSLLPALERPALEISVDGDRLGGQAREEVLETLTRPLERRLTALAGVTSVRTWTEDGGLRARVESEWQTDGDRLRIEADRLLADLGAPVTIEMATGDPEPIVEVAVLGGASGAARTAFARKLLVPELARLEGAGRIETAGLTPLHAVVHPEDAALAARGLTPADLVGRLRSVGVALPAGRARAGSAVRPLLVREDAASLDDLRAVRIGGSFLGFLGDVARVDLEEVEDATFFRLNGEDGVLVRVFRAPEANAVSLAALVRSRVEELSARSGKEGPRLRVVEDRSREVVAALAQLGIAALIGVGLGVVVLKVMLGRWRPTLALAVVVPASMLTAFAGFQLGGASLDVVSLAGLALAAGMLVDSSVVVLEAIEVARANGSPAPAVDGTREIALPVVASFLTTAVVFLPLIYLQGLARAFFGVQAFAIVTSLAASLLFSLTVTPVLSGNAPAPENLGRSPGRRAYLRLLDGSLARPVVVVLAGTATAAVAILALAVLPRELVPDAPSRELVVRYRLPQDLSPEAARRLGHTVALVASRSGSLSTTAAMSAMATQLPEDTAAGADREETGQVVLAFADADAAGRARSAVRSALARLPDVEAWVEPRTSAFVEPIERAGRRLEVLATAATPERAAALAERVRTRLGGLKEVGIRRNRPRPALLLTWDATRLAELGADRGLLETQVRQGLGELYSGRVRIEGVEPEILVRPSGAAGGRDPGLRPVGAPGNFPIVPLRALARIVPGLRPAILERLDGRSAERLVFEGEALGAGNPEALLAGLARSADERVAPGGQALELARAFAQLRLALALSLLLVFLTVAALYESLRLPLVIMATVPVAAGGALGLLAVTGQTLNVLSFLGLILLAGIVVNNAIVLVHRIEERRHRGEAMDEAIRAAGRERYRPILMTTATTVAGMLPLALLPGEGVELQRALAICVIGGMITSTFASLLLVPVLYRWMIRTERAR
jgi:HAE1 family hydrophobic/amphiphilic exporter-1